MFFAFVAMSLVQAGDVDSYLGEIEAKYKDVKALKVNFTQETSNEFLPAPYIQEGKLSLAKPSNLHWNITSPVEQHYYVDAEKLTVWNPAQNQAIISSNEAQNSEITSLLTNLSKLKEQYKIQLVDEEAERIHFKLQSQELQGELELWFSQKELFLEEITVKTSNATTKLKFSAFDLNPTLDAKEFTFTPQKDTDIIDSRQ